MTLDQLIEALENARISDEIYLSERESKDLLRASVDGLVLPIEKVTVGNGRVLIHIDMYRGHKAQEQESKNDDSAV
jgi:glycerol-3-phosphate responsive antiterminator